MWPKNLIFLSAIFFLIIETDEISPPKRYSITPQFKCINAFLSPLVITHDSQPYEAMGKAVALGDLTLIPKLIPLLFPIDTMFCTAPRPIASRLLIFCALLPLTQTTQIACKRYINVRIWLESLHYGYG